jgi:uncharacterized damage-inducible protein DinB
MPTAAQYINRIAFADRMIKLSTEGLTQADTMKQFPFPANCMNWNLGHILVFRDRCLGAIDGTIEADPAEYAIYGAGSEPLTDPSKALPLDVLLERLDERSEQIKDALLSLPVEKFSEPYKTHTLDDQLIIYIMTHEALHVGQLEILREFVLM